MKTMYRNIPAMRMAADADVEALRRQLEGGNLEANNDGTVSLKGSTSTHSAAHGTSDAGKKKLGDIPGGVLGAESLSEILARVDEQKPLPEQTARAEAGGEEHAKDPKKSMGNIPSGVLGADTSEKNTVSPEVAAMINEFRSDEGNAENIDSTKESKKLGDIPGGVLGTTGV